MQKPVVLSLLNKPDPNGHGGQRRSLQISELVDKANVEHNIVFSVHNNRKGLFGKIERYFRGWIRNQQLFCYPRWGKINSRNGSCIYPLDNLNPGIWIIEDTRWPINIYQAKKNGWRVIAVPQNFESIYYAQENGFSPFNSAKLLSDEVAALSHADIVYCISREEQHLLLCLGINAQFLPYYPSKKTQINLNKIRIKRESTFKRHILMLVSAINPASKAGIMSFFSRLSDDTISNIPPIILAGYGTNELIGMLESKKVQVLGQLSESMANDYQSHAVAMVAHQDYGLGCLTKIQDYLIAGIPVLANDVAARSYWGSQGLHVYRDVNEISAILAAGLKEPAVSSEADSYFANFTNKVSLLAAGVN